MKVFVIIASFFAATFAAPSLPALQPSVASGRIIGGTKADEGAHPYIVSLEYAIFGINNGHTCGGSIITPRTILTAGHCQTELPASGTYTCLAGLTKRSSREFLQSRRVESRLAHPDYTGGVSPSDIAIFILAEALELTARVAVVALPESAAFPTPGDSLLVGWGYDESGRTPDDLLQANKDVITLEDCNRELTALLGSHPLDVSRNTNVCTGGLASGGLSACSGDSGGPLVRSVNNVVTEIGIVSWGITPCGYARAPSVYVNVAQFLDWISQNKV